MDSLFPFRQFPGMNHEPGSIVIQNEYHLQQPATQSRSPDNQFLAADSPRIRTSCGPNHILCFFGSDAVLGEMLDVPLDPSKVHGSPHHHDGMAVLFPQ
jgi:hypothetical protein